MGKLSRRGLFGCFLAAIFGKAALAPPKTVTYGVRTTFISRFDMLACRSEGDALNMVLHRLEEAGFVIGRRFDCDYDIEKDGWCYLQIGEIES